MKRVDEVLTALRQIIRAIDLHSKKLNKTSSLTGPQLLLMRAIDGQPGDTTRNIARIVNLSQATVTSIIDRLEARGLVIRERSTLDKRKVMLDLTDAGRELLAKAPAPLQQAFITRFESLEEWEQSLILSSLQRVASMMNADDLDASPMLTLDTITPTTKD
ncbi:MarR family transcriptional regulator [Gallaecimonas sp. GXIMD4217]|uniref:MarR family winged helix-turn-helix transcriptional regulator n=1 Tax=Gallaecimonas sp. GXIMD4217 TaxID=3131927 RepID=UPI00311B29DD